ncbi:MAG: DsbA family oxidoreductase [Gordonia sp. (in: high G+C Gram-positive bacteria)]
MQVEIWADVNCPFCYIGLARFNKAFAAFAEADQIEVVHRSFELDPSSPRNSSGQVVEYLAERYGLSLEDASQGEVRLAEQAGAEGLDYVLSGRDFGNSFDMHRLVHFAAETGRSEEMLNAFFHANFAEEATLFGDPERLVQVAVGAGFDETQVRAVVDDENRFAQDVRDDEELALKFKIQGVPHFVFDRYYAVSGAQPADIFTDALTQAWERYRGEK